MVREQVEKQVKVTARDVVPAPDEKITEVARGLLLDELHLGTDEGSIRYSFGLILMGITITPAAAKKIGAFYGTPLRGAYYCNGNPLCGDLGWLHHDDLPRLRAELIRMKRALGLPVEDA